MSSTVDVTTDQTVQELLTTITASLTGVLDQMGWAEDEIKLATARHPHRADTLYHSLSLLTPTFDRMSTPFVFESHCRELLARVVDGHDLRPGTAAEVCLAISRVSQATPVLSSAAGLYMRMWLAAGFPHNATFAEFSAHHEALEKSVIDDFEQFARNKLAVPSRQLGEISCAGRHHGEDVVCVYAQTEQVTLDTRPAALTAGGSLNDHKGQ